MCTVDLSTLVRTALRVIYGDTANSVHGNEQHVLNFVPHYFLYKLTGRFQFNCAIAHRSSETAYSRNIRTLHQYLQKRDRHIQLVSVFFFFLLTTIFTERSIVKGRNPLSGCV